MMSRIVQQTSNDPESIAKRKENPEKSGICCNCSVQRSLEIEG